MPSSRRGGSAGAGAAGGSWLQAVFCGAVFCGAVPAACHGGPPGPQTGSLPVTGRATAKIHCASDEDSDQDLVDFQVEQAITASLKGRRRAFADHLVEFSVAYAERVRADHALFVDAFRSGQIGVAAT